MNTGLIIPEITPDNFVFGDGRLGDSPINPSGQWGQYLPTPVNQDIGLEPMCCTTEGCRNCVNVLRRQKYGVILDICLRFLAYISGTTHQGNNPHTVAEALRTKGDVLEADYPYTPDINTWEKFYAIPAKWLYTKALVFTAEYSFGHSWVSPATQQAMMDALTYSPLSAGVYAWATPDSDGIYHRPAGAISEHDVMIYGYVANNYWLCFDSYDQNIKKLAWDFGFDAVKRYTLNRQTVNTPQAQSAWSRFLSFMQDIIAKMRYGSFGGVARSPLWSATRKEHLKIEPLCQICGTKGSLLKPNEVHHLQSFATHPELENEQSNLITGCRIHHQWFYHLGSWESLNESALADSLAWYNKIAHRPKWNGKEWVYPV